MAQDHLLDIKSVVNKSILKFNLEKSRLLIAVSGGQDSLALIHIMNSLKKDLSLDLVVAHLNHNLRGIDSDLDSEFVVNLSNNFNVPFVVGNADVKSIQEVRKLSLEEAAREARYEFLAKTVLEKSVDAVVVGHTFTDQSETVIFNAIRGSGLKGISGMSTMSFLSINGSRVPIFRPLLKITREQTLQYCLNNDLQPRYDSSNNLQSITRNKIRHQLIPSLKEFNVNVEESLVRLASTAAEANDFIRLSVNKVIDQYVIFENDKIVIKNNVVTLHPALTSNLIMQALVTFGDGLKNIKQAHVKEIIKLMHGGTAKEVNLPNGMEAYKFKDTTILSFKKHFSTVNIDGRYIIKIPGITNIPGWTINSSFEKILASDFLNKDNKTVKVDKQLAAGNIWVRGWQNGDRMQPLGMMGTKKVQDIFIDHKIPKVLRHSMPVICSDKGIIWVAGCGISDWAKVPNKGSEALKFAATEIHTK